MNQSTLDGCDCDGSRSSVINPDSTDRIQGLGGRGP